MPTTTTRMALTVPVVGDPSPAHVAAVAASLATLDAHNHANGGAQVPVAGLNINAALPLRGNSARRLRSARLQSLGGALAAEADYGSAFVTGGDLYFLDAEGRAVRFTNGGSLNSGGAFEGEYISAGALATYSATTKRYTFLDEFTVLAAVQGGEILCTGFGGFGNSAPAIGADGVSLLPANTAADSTMVSAKGDVRAQGGFAHTSLAVFRTGLTTGMGGFDMRGIGGSQYTHRWVAPRSGSVLGVSYYYSSIQTAGTLSFRVVKTGGSVVATTASFTAGQAGSTTWAKDTRTFAAGDMLYIDVSSSGTFAPTGGTVVAYLHVEY